MAGSSYLVVFNLYLQIIAIGLKTVTDGQILDPPYFNIATGKTIEATSTCGEGVAGPELFCKLTGNTGTETLYGERHMNLIQGQYCDFCNPSSSSQAHPAYHAIDGTERWWQSPPLSRSLDFNEVNITIDFGQQFHVAYIIIKFANSPRPAIWVLERSTDYGRTFTPWQYFASTDTDCNTQFGMHSLLPIKRDDQVICSTEYSKIVPLENGEIVVSLVNGRPNANNFSHAEILQEWTKATNVRIQMIRTNTLLSHLLALARQDPTVTRRYYYSIKDISIGGRCVCNGHADRCDTPAPGNPSKLLCTCRHNTCGDQCEQCCPGYVQKKWRPATISDANECEPCNCYGHTTECVYNEEVARRRQSLDIYGEYEGGGVCQNCQHNTEGINCEKCKAGYYRPRGVQRDSPDVCQKCDCNFFYSTGSCADETGQCECRPEYAGPNCDRCADGYYGYPACRPCDCHRNGTEGGVCQVGGGQCPCKFNYDGLNCDQCQVGFYNFPECLACNCDRVGSQDFTCDSNTGQCSCHNNYGGRACDACDDGFYSYPACQACYCDSFGTTDDICDKETGQCICREKYGGHRCTSCDNGYYNYPNCYECDCEIGSAHNGCTESGQCPCLSHFSGKKCDMCATGYFKYPECIACNCHRSGSLSIACDQLTGQCNCRSNFMDVNCNQCSEGFYNFPACEECKCDPAGVVAIPGEPLGGCGAATRGLCRCKERVVGRTCNMCKPLYWNLMLNNPLGCEECYCFTPGTVAGVAVCQSTSGQCNCKEYVDGRQCDQCQDGAFNLQEQSIFGCEACGCDVGGARDAKCDKSSGQCVCKPRINGRTCDRPLDVHFFPDLYHMKYEIEDGRAPRDKPVRFGFSELDFPGFSWRGYAVMSSLQSEVVIPIDVPDASLYRIVIRYLSLNADPVNGYITVSPQIQSELAGDQSSSVIYNPSRDPQFVTVSGNTIIMPFVMDPGKWIVSLIAPENIFLDYFVLLPSAYYEASVLQERVTDTCIAGTYQEACNKYEFPRLTMHPTIEGENGYYDLNGQRRRTQTFQDSSILQELEIDAMALLNRNQPSLALSLPIPRPGRYAMVIQYYGGDVQPRKLEVFVQGDRDRRQEGFANIYDCKYLCRTVVLDTDGRVAQFDGQQSVTGIILNQEGIFYDLAIDSVTLIPIEDWHMDYVTAAFKCTHKRPSDECVGTPYLTPPGSQKWEAETNVYLPRNSRGHGVHGKDITPNVDDPNTALYTLDGSGDVASMEMRDVLPDSGRYVFVVHYYQPETVSYTADFDMRGTPSYSGTFEAKFCPHVSGCRSVVRGTDGNEVFEMNSFVRDMIITVPDDKSLWLDYVMAVPEDMYSPDVLESQPIDRAGEFIQECGQNDFYISPDSTGFCRDGVFSLSSDYNNGAQPCECNFVGATSFACNEFGGQCPCRPNIIGRTCDRCKTGYYGFPNCRPCGCVTGICDESTGECICPPNVGGPNCDQCMPNTFGYDPFIGCEECNCNPRGVVNGDTSCDPVTGQCNCETYIAGRQCDKCTPGYYSYPRCLPCNCDLLGTTEEICDQGTSLCLCKENVEGSRCDQCKTGTFYLESRNPAGCTDCFCFGATNDCRSSSRTRMKISTMDGWRVSNLKDGRVRKSGDSTLTVTPGGSGDDPTKAIYWIAPVEYLGNKITSYGGVLEYIVLYRELRSDVSPTPLRRPDLILSGNNIELVYMSPSQPLPLIPLTVRVDILEGSFQHSIGSGPVSREELMMALAGLEKLYIRAQYMTEIESASLSSTSLDVAEKRRSGSPPAENVEQCRCPSSYRGLSCERCEVGHYRTGTAGAYLGTCTACQCHGHAERCNPNTGECVDCKDGTTGRNCEICKTGYVGDATQGTTNDCQICACPYAIESNNFASSCTVGGRGDTETCICLPGYVGPRCDSCADGYYGDPTVIGGSCQTCDCNGNVDPNYDGAMCDKLKGNCLRCRPGTTGDNCEMCAEGYYGDAINARDCRECDCDACGTHRCDPNTGSCICRLGVDGLRCDRCPKNYYGFSSCQGCLPCDCGQASGAEQCDEVTGQCECMPGVSGKECNECLPGYWDYTPVGCRRCDCGENLRCDVNTGACICLPGAKGPRCDQCEERYILTEQGCMPCDDCVNILLDEVEILNHNISEVGDNLHDISVGVGALKRLEQINETAYELKAQLPNAKKGYTGNLEPFRKELKDLQKKADRLEDESRRAKDDGKDTAIDAGNTEDRALDVEKLVEEAAKKVKDAVDFAIETADTIGQNGDKDSDALLKEARKIVREIDGRDFSDPMDNAGDELELAKDALKRAQRIQRKGDLQEEECNRVEDGIDNVMDKFRELIDLSDETNAVLDEVDIFNDLNKDPEYKRIVKEAKDKFAMTEDTVEDAQDLLNRAKDYLDEADKAVQITALESSKLDAGVERLEPYVDHLKEQNEILEPLVENATIHAHNLRRQANRLDDLIADTREYGENAIEAAKAYEHIEEALVDAMAAARAAKVAADNAADMSEGQADIASNSKRKSDRLRKKAKTAKEKVEGDLSQRLDNAKDNVKRVEQLNKDTNDGLQEIKADIDTIPSDNLAAKARQAVNTAEAAKGKAQEAKNKILNIADELPDKMLQVQQYPVDVADINRAMNKAETSLNKLKLYVPQAQALLGNMGIQKARVMDVHMKAMGNLTELKDKIERARDQAARIDVAMTFRPTTTLQLRSIPEPYVQETEAYTTMSLYFNTTRKKGFLAFLGGLETDNDYLALQIKDGKPVFNFDVGSGPAEITGDFSVANGKWHQVLVERTGRAGKLIVKRQGKADSVFEGLSPPTFSILDLKSDPYFFVGGVPQGTTLPATLNERRFIGCIGSLEFMGRPIGLWNFAEAANADTGCKESSDLKPAVQNVFTMDGRDSYIMKDKTKLRFNPFDRATIDFQFKSFADDALFFYAGKDTDFMAVELRDGHVFYHYELGAGIAEMISTEKYNNGEWVRVTAIRVKNQGRLMVDGKEVAAADSPETHVGLGTENILFIGGIRGITVPSAVKTVSFKGCIKEVQLGQAFDDLNDNNGSKGLFIGCQELSARTASFKSTEGYVAMAPVDINRNADVSMRIRSTQSDGLVMFSTNGNQGNAFSISVVGGRIIVQVKSNGNTFSVTSSNNNYNDGGWHFIAAIKQGLKLSLTVDDTDFMEVLGSGKKKTVTDSYLYFGGVPSTYNIDPAIVPTTEYFIGCVSDPIVNGVSLDFSQNSGSSGLSLAGCSIGLEVKGPSVIDETIATPIVTSPCALPLRPSVDKTATDAGYRFGNSVTSRYEYDFLPEKFKLRSEYTVDIKTTATQGLIFYMADDRQVDFISLYLLDSRIVYAFNCGSGTLTLITEDRYNDGKWHSVKFFREQTRGELYVDGKPSTPGTSPGSALNLNVSPPFYKGGVPSPDAAKNVQTRARTSFDGCIRDFKLNDVDFGEPARQYDVVPCLTNTEGGTYFGVDGGHIVWSESFKVGLDLAIEMDIKPRALSGIIASVQGARGDFFSLELVDGNMILSADNGEGAFHTMYEPSQSDGKAYLCDGQWHSVHAVKAKDVVYLTIDNKPDNNYGQLTGQQKSTDTNDPLYIGGLPAGVKHKGISTNDNFVGCIRNFSINDNATVNFNNVAEISGAVQPNSCPAT
ncbi:laminin subunit alpha-5-like [Glandiceps talaboti]